MATACANPPAGRARWTLELLADAMVKLTEYESLSHETVRRRLAENGLKPWRKDMWCIPKVDGEYVARMEDVLDLYAEAPIPRGRWSASTRARSSSSARCASRSRPSRANSNAMITSIAATAPSISSSASTSTGRGARSSHRAARSRRLRPMRARTHRCPLSRRRVQAFAPAEARRILRRLEFHYTPKHASWLNMVEIEIGVCAVSAWTAESTTRNAPLAKSPRGNDSETPLPPASNGCPQPPKPAPKWAVPIPTRSKSHNHCAEVLVFWH